MRHSWRQLRLYLTYDEALSKLLYVMKEPVAKLARGLVAVKDQKEAEAA